MPIYVNTDNSNRADPIYNGHKAGDSSDAAEEAMAAAEKRVLTDKKVAGDFTITDVGKGYTIYFKVEKVTVQGRNTSVTLSGSIERYPKSQTKNRGAGSEMVTTGMHGSATATGVGDGAVQQCVDAITESLVEKALPIMRMDMTKR